jgi:hypothetical protein
MDISLWRRALEANPKKRAKALARVVERTALLLLSHGGTTIFAGPRFSARNYQKNILKLLI